MGDWLVGSKEDSEDHRPGNSHTLRAEKEYPQGRDADLAGGGGHAAAQEEAEMERRCCPGRTGLDSAL